MEYMPSGSIEPSAEILGSASLSNGINMLELANKGTWDHLGLMAQA
jgi:hypothetical protein